MIFWSKFWFPTILLVSYFLITWIIAGRYFGKKIIYPNYDTPTDISPSVARYLLNGKLDNIGFVAQLINLQLKGFVKIITTNGVTKILISDKNQEFSQLLNDEKAVYDQLFKQLKAPINLSYKRDIRMANAKIINKKSAKEYCFKANFLKRNWLVASLTILLSVIYIFYIGVTIFPKDSYENILPIFFAVPFVALLAIPFLFYTKGVLRVFCVLFFTLLFYFIHQTTMPFKATLFIPLVVVVVTFFYVINIRIFTKKGALKRAEIKGLKLYLSVAEKERFKFYNSLKNKISIFEKYLPFAIAFNLKNDWVKVVENVIDEMSYDTSQIISKTTSLSKTLGKY